MERISNQQADAPADMILRGAIMNGYPLVPVDSAGKAAWGPVERRKLGTNVPVLESYSRAKWRFAVDWQALGCVVTVGVGTPFAAPIACWTNDEGLNYAAYKGEHPGSRKWQAGIMHGKFLAKSKLVPIDPALLGGLRRLSDAEPVDFGTVLVAKGKRAPTGGPSRTERLLDLQSDPAELLHTLFPEGTVRAEGRGWRVSTDGMVDNIAVNPVGKAGELMFKDFGDPPAFPPGDALVVMEALGMSGNEVKRPQVTGTRISRFASAPVANKDADIKARLVRSVWRAAWDLHDGTNDAAWEYIHRRGVKVPDGASILYDDQCDYGPGEERPCLVAGVTGDMNPSTGKNVTAVQRIPVDGGTKKTLGKVVGAVNVSGKRIEDTLGVAEGVVTALAAQARFEVPFVATLGTGAMKSLKAPESVTTLLIAADHDEKGQGLSAARTLAAAHPGIQVRILYPSVPGKDFADPDCGEPVEDAPLAPTAAKPADVVLAPEVAMLGGVQGLGETVFASEFIGAYGHRFKFDGRFAESNGAWVEWTQGRWDRRTMPPRRQVARIIRMTCGEDEKALAKFDRSSTQTGVLKTIAEGCERRSWDQAPNLVGLPGGLVLDLDTGDTRDQVRKDFITRTTAVLPADDAGEFPSVVLDLCGGDESLYQWCRSLAVDCATGKAGKDMLAIVQGVPGTGKSTVWNAVHRCLGDYAGSVLSKHLLVARNQPHLSWLAGLVDKRMVLTSEVPPGMTWDGPLVSMLTGGDVVSANFMHKNHFEFVPAFRMIVLCNDIPALPSDASGIRRRARVLVFDQVRGGRGMGEDDSIRELYCDSPEGQAQVLRWVADAAREVNGRAPEFRYPHCAKVEAATNEYLDERDDFSTWYEAAVVPGDAFHTTTAHAAYNAWAEKVSAMRLSREALGTEIAKRMGRKSAKVTVGGQRGLGYRGYTLKEQVSVRPKRKRGPQW